MTNIKRHNLLTTVDLVNVLSTQVLSTLCCRIGHAHESIKGHWSVNFDRPKSIPQIEKMDKQMLVLQKLAVQESVHLGDTQRVIRVPSLFSACDSQRRVVKGEIVCQHQRGDR